MRVLLVTYYFPPAGGGGVQRALGWCRHLPAHGVDVTVLAPREPRWIDVDPTLVVPAATDVIRTSDPSPQPVIPRDAVARAGRLGGLWRQLLLQPRRFAVPDIHRRWRGPAVAAALAAGRDTPLAPWDVVLSTSPPETTHLVASDIASSLGIPWVADFRDSWLDLPHLRLQRPDVRLKHALNARLAHRVMAHAAAATTVSQPLAADLRVRHPHLSVQVIENGVERDDVARARERAAGFREPERFVLCYTGNFFGRQSPATLLSAIELLLRDQPAVANELVVRFVGGLKAGDRQRIADSPLLRQAVDQVGFLRHDDVLAQQAAADALFLYVAPGRASRGVYTGKVFEYVAAQRPVLALAPADNVATALLERAGSTSAPGGAAVAPDDVEATRDAIAAALRLWRSQGRLDDVPVPEDVLERISRASGAARLATLLAQVVDR